MPYPLNEYFWAYHRGAMFHSIITNGSTFELSIMNHPQAKNYRFTNLSIHNYLKILLLSVELKSVNDKLLKVGERVRARNSVKKICFLIDEVLENLDQIEWHENISILNFLTQMIADIEQLKHDLYFSNNPTAFEHIHLRPLFQQIVALRHYCKLYLEFFACDQEPNGRPNYRKVVEKNLCSRF
jgi:hypothetical protein